MAIIHEVPMREKLIAITFDDGPHPIYTPQLLEIFDAVGGKATFFMVGEEMQKHRDLVKKVYDVGHEIGNHTYTHPHLSKLSMEQCLDEIERNENLVEELVGQKPVVFRPPYFDYNDEVIGILGEKGYPMIGAMNGEARDWEQPGVEHIYKASLDAVKEGSILIFHDGYGDRSQSVEAVRKLVHEVGSQGYQFVTVSRLLEEFKG